MSGRVLGALAGGGVALAAGATWLVLASNHDDNPAATLAFVLTAGLSFVGSGLVALWRRPENRTGILLVAVGYLWFLGALTESGSDWVFTIGIALNSVVFGAFVHLLLAFPWGRLGSRRDVSLVAATYALVIVDGLALLTVDERPAPDCSTCLSTVALTNNETAATAVQLTVTMLSLALLAAILASVGRRFIKSSPALRRVLGPVIATGALTMLVAVAELVADIFSEAVAGAIGVVFVATFATVPLAFLAGILRARLARSAVGELLLKLGAGGASLREALAQALHDPSLDIVYWLPQRGVFVWHDGNPFVDEGGPRTARYVEHDGKRVAALLHDPSLADEPELVDAVAAAAGLWLANEQLQAELRAQYDFLQTIVNTAPSLLMSLDLEGRIANFNTACERASGYDDVEEVRNQYFWDVFIAAEDRDAVRRRFLTDPVHLPSEYENTFVNRRGEELVIAWSTAPLRDEHGDVRNIICGGLDVTERKRRELELQGERDFLDTMADSIPSLIVLTDREGQIVPDGVNLAFRETFGWTMDETTRHSFLEFVHSEDDYAVRMAIAAAANGVARTDLESRWLPREGEPLLVSWAATPISHPSDPKLVLVTGEDATDRKRRESDLRSSEERLRAAIEASPVAIVEYALDDTITRWNPAAERIFGWTAEEVVGGLAKHQPPERATELAELFRRVRNGDIYTGVESRRNRKDGASIDVEISAAPIRDVTGEVISHMALFADITERKLQEEEVRASRSRIVQAADDARRMLERNLHDGAQQRLVALSLSLRLAQTRIGCDPDAAETILGDARDELSLAIEDLRELARGIHPAVLTDRGLEAAVLTLATRSLIPVEVSVPAERLPGAVEAAAYYVVAEALTNVAKYAQASLAHVRVSRDNGRAVVEVADDGVGGASAGAGSGLRGLADRVAALDGTLAIESPPGAGTRIRAELPLSLAQDRNLREQIPIAQDP
ncbi:MAG: PAS domain S-box protein [Gaiellaceae bacterium MAG52_C11]|nr:PAS domain S-box protein [Candidatus Gaiellasilicea maunaloa]